MEQSNASTDARRDAECSVIEREFSDGHWICERPSGHYGQHKFVWRFGTASVSRRDTFDEPPFDFEEYPRD